MGAKHSLFEVAVDVLQRAEDIDSPESIAEALKATSPGIASGKVDSSAGPVPSVSKTPVVGGQWQVRANKPVPEIVTSSRSPPIPLTAEMKPIAWGGSPPPGLPVQRSGRFQSRLSARDLFHLARGSMTPILTMRGENRFFVAFHVTQDIDPDLAPGEAPGVIGPNGAGKSTLFNLTAGSLPPSSGTGTFRGGDITGLPASERCHPGIGRSFQIPHPFIGMPVYENPLAAPATKCQRRPAGTFST
ncbi:ATP-binding cassette domain-containing protein [Poseidonocella sp. HB161398]|uniref:ATP-binding cassette domain-containing protein n=1 Tax=Poseidonocella sp. HB161398 TaxID=2320855 RepID=UPI00272ADC74|nr:ATP-binding cassette domain-containing protein [Poseidonocella sp. HB161398]